MSLAIVISLLIALPSNKVVFIVRRRFSCTDPMLRIKMHYSKREAARPSSAGTASGAVHRRSSVRRQRYSFYD